MTVDETKQAQFAFSGIDRWHKAGYTGQGVVVWNRETDGGHGKTTRSVIEKIAPGALVLSASINAAFRGDELLYCEAGGKPIEDFIKENNVKVINSSISEAKDSAGYRELWKRLVKEYNLIICNAAGNYGAEGVKSDIPAEHSMQIGAVTLVDGKPRITYYSSIGEEVDFANFTLWLSGTSFSSPYTAGMCALLVERYGKQITQDEVYAMLKRDACDAGEPGDDIYYGWGVPTMPDLNKRYITLTIGDEIMYVDGKAIPLDTAPIVDENNRTLVPIRAIAEALGCEVGWIGAEKKVTITEG